MGIRINAVKEVVYAELDPISMNGLLGDYLLDHANLHLDGDCCGSGWISNAVLAKAASKTSQLPAEDRRYAKRWLAWSRTQGDGGVRVDVY